MLPTICALSLLGVAAAQTPANWYPSANKTLGIAYDEYVVTPGRVMSADSKWVPILPITIRPTDADVQM